MEGACYGQSGLALLIFRCSSGPSQCREIRITGGKRGETSDDIGGSASHHPSCVGQLKFWMHYLAAGVLLCQNYSHFVDHFVDPSVTAGGSSFLHFAGPCQPINADRQRVEPKTPCGDGLLLRDFRGILPSPTCRSQERPREQRGWCFSSEPQLDSNAI